MSQKATISKFGFLAAFGMPAWAQVGVWPVDTRLSSGSGEHGVANTAPPGIASVPVGSGETFVIWESRSLGTILAQRMRADGEVVWPDGGIPAAPGDWYKGALGAVADGKGGVIVAWLDGRNGGCTLTWGASCDIYAQRLSPDGDRMWGSTGVPVTRARMNQGVSGIGIATDGAGGAIIAWEDARDCCQFYAQRVDSSGAAVWTSDGVLVSQPTRYVGGPVNVPPVVVADGAGGVYVLWYNHQVPDGQRSTIQVQRLSSGGEALWAEYGTAIGEPQYMGFSATEDGQGGVLAAWTATGTDRFADVHVQRVGPSGQPLWSAGGVSLVSLPDTQTNPAVVSDGAGGAIVSWQDWRNHDYASLFPNRDIYAQRVNAAGQPLWTDQGVPVAMAPGDQLSSRLVADGSGGATVAWQDCRGLTQAGPCADAIRIYVQRLRPDGSAVGLRNGGGLVAPSVPRNQGVNYGSKLTTSFVMVTDGSGGAVLAWPDGRHARCEFTIGLTGCTVYAQRVTKASLSYLPGAFFTLSPCRVLDTRDWRTSVPLSAGEDRAVAVAGRCGVPASATGVSSSFAVTGASSGGHLRLGPGDAPMPGASALNYAANQPRSNAAILPLGMAGTLKARAVQPFGTVHLVIDVNGYFQ